MAKAYSDDLRRKILGEYDHKAGSLRELSERFCVSYAWARKISWQRRHSGQMERVEQRHGSPSRATAEVEARLRSLPEQPDRTLVELQQGLGEAEGCTSVFSICGDCSGGWACR
jgi:transposase